MEIRRLASVEIYVCVKLSQDQVGVVLEDQCLASNTNIIICLFRNIYVWLFIKAAVIMNTIMLKTGSLAASSFPNGVCLVGRGALSTALRCVSMVLVPSPRMWLFATQVSLMPLLFDRFKAFCIAVLVLAPHLDHIQLSLQIFTMDPCIKYSQFMELAIYDRPSILKLYFNVPGFPTSRAGFVHIVKNSTTSPIVLIRKVRSGI